MTTKAPLKAGKAYLAKDGETVFFVQQIKLTRKGKLKVWYLNVSRPEAAAPPALKLSHFARRLQGEVPGWDGEWPRRYDGDSALALLEVTR